MTRLARIAPVLALLAFGCKPTAPAHGKMGTSIPIAPPTVRVIPVGLDPNVAPIPGAVGDIIQVSGSQQAYALTLTGWQAFPGPSSAVATTTSAGLMSAAQAATMANTSGGIALVSFESSLVDLTQTISGVVIVPALAGKSFIALGGGVRQMSTSGTASTAATIRMGNDVNHSNMFTAAANLPTTTVFGFGSPAFNKTAFNAAPSPANTPIDLDVTVAATGTSLVWTAVYTIFGYYF